MIEKLCFRFLLIFLQSGIEDGLKVGRGGSAGESVSLGHDFVEEKTRMLVGSKKRKQCGRCISRW